MYARWVLTALLVWPAVAAVAILIAPPRWAKHLGFVASLIEFAIAVPLWWTFVPSGGMQFVCDAPWIQVPLFGTGAPWSIHYTVGVDGISLFMVLLTTLLVPLSVLGSYSYITTRERAYYALLLVLTSGMIGVFVALDLFLFYVMWEVMLIPMYFIIGVWGGENRLYAAIKFFIYTMFGSLLMLVAILALVYLVGQRTGVFSFDYFHLMRNLGGLVAMVQPDFKKLIAYSSVAHLGFVMLGIWALTLQSVQGALLVMINHGISTGALFFLVGMIYERRHSRLIAAYGGIARVVPLFAAILTFVSLSAIGLPGTNGFVGEFLVLVGAFRTHPVAAGIAATGVIVAAAYLLWALQRVIFNPLDKPENEKLLDLTPRELAVLLPLVACIVWIGVYPKPILDRMEPAARQFIESVRPPGPTATAIAP